MHRIGRRSDPGLCLSQHSGVAPRHGFDFGPSQATTFAETCSKTEWKRNSGTHVEDVRRFALIDITMEQFKEAYSQMPAGVLIVSR